MTVFHEDGVSTCQNSFGHEDFQTNRVQKGYPHGCPVKGCTMPLVEIPFGKRSPRPFCAEHGLRLHSNTFVYWNGREPDKREIATRRNFPIRPDLLSGLLKTKQKAETGRLGSEMSEDALSWNVFVALAEAGKLTEVASLLTGQSLTKEPTLYLWGHLIDLTGTRHERYRPLDAVRANLEKGIGRFKTEPDIMLVVRGEFLLCIEAKFGSGNSLAHESPIKSGDKPTDRSGLLHRYLTGAASTTRDLIDPRLIADVFHSQLFRNVVFAAEMANGVRWHVVNLVSATQWDRAERAPNSSYENPTMHVRQYLRDDVREQFTSSTWEDLHRTLVASDAQLRTLDTYMRSKSAHFAPAFIL